MSFQVLTQLGGCTNSSRKKIKGSGGSYETSIRFTRLGRLKRTRLQITDSVSRWLSVQDARMGFHICIVGYLFGIPVLLLWEDHLMIRFFLSSTLYTASRKACHGCCKQSLIITPEITHYGEMGRNSKNALLCIVVQGENVELKIMLSPPCASFLGSGSDTKPRLGPLSFGGRFGRPSAFFRLEKGPVARKHVIVGEYRSNSDLPPFHYLLS